MGALEVVIAAAVALALLTGYLWGRAGERAGWKAKVVDSLHPDRTAHYCDGRFLYVVEEGYFLRAYYPVSAPRAERVNNRPLLPPEGERPTADVVRDMQEDARRYMTSFDDGEPTDEEVRVMVDEARARRCTRLPPEGGAASGT